ncbi:hypothetical protein PY32053_01954 [Paracoccus yeei]|uniref:Uncharacterized protein n=1 Tax=Paracoccus yeei TaxID=147645 RepID=A0A386UM25_9RHOB|nr:hypothetical protein PY32053_01954 [Paracoccus yeei]
MFVENVPDIPDGGLDKGPSLTERRAGRAAIYRTAMLMGVFRI